MAKVVSIYKAVGQSLQHNTDLLRDKTKAEMVEVLSATVAEFKKKSKNQDLYFRLSYSGDLFSEDYAEAWAEVIKQYPEVYFWTYTRSHTKEKPCYTPLLGIDNLTLYLSCDPSNYEDTKELFNSLKDKYPTLGIAYMGDNPPDQEDMRWVVCPETSGKIKSTEDYGACSKCRLCIDNYKIRVKNIAFQIH